RPARIEPGVGSCGDKRGQAGHPVPSAESLKVFFKHLIRRYLSIGINIGRVGILFELAVLQSQAGNEFRVVVAAVAGEARYARLAAEVVPVRSEERRVGKEG